MRRGRVALLSGVVGAAAAIALVACVDLFHSTSDIVDGCELDAGLEGCAPPAPDVAIRDAAPDTFDGNYDFCAFDAATARANAETACAWLGACETPLGDNRYATCVEHAILAYDCAANPNMQPRGDSRDFWNCMVGARDCASVHACAWGVDQPSCPANASPITVCDHPLNGPLLPRRGQCPTDGGNTPPQPHAENCAAWGQTCSVSPEGLAQCAGDPSGYGNGDCTTPTCSGTLAYSCDDAGDNLGVDCQNYGTGACVSPGGFAACAPNTSTPCEAGVEVLCTADGVHAVGCPAGATVEIDCKAVTENLGGCTPTLDPPAWDVSRACFDGGACGPDSCGSGSTITSCDRGVVYTYDCGMDFGGCRVVSTADGDRAACIAP